MDALAQPWSTVMRWLAGSPDPGAQLVALAERARMLADAPRALLAELDPGSRTWSTIWSHGASLAHPTEWPATETDAALLNSCGSAPTPRVVDALEEWSVGFSDRLTPGSAILLPVAAPGEAPPVGLLVLARRHDHPVPPEVLEAVDACGAAMTLAARLRSANGRLARETRFSALQEQFADRTRVSGWQTAVESLCGDLVRELGAKRVSYWLHDRNARRLHMLAASDGSHLRRPAASPTDDPDALLVAALRGSAVRFLQPPKSEQGHASLVIPLRGQRRALGVIVAQHVAVVPGESDALLAVATTLGRFVSRVVDAQQLLRDVLAAHRELSAVFEALSDGVMVLDDQLRVVRLNDAVAAKLGKQASALGGRFVGELVGADTAAWLDSMRTAPVSHHASRDLPPSPLGTRVRAWAATVPADGERPARTVVVTRDVSGPLDTSGEWAGIRERLGRAEALAGLVAGIAHEVNTPLQTVIGQVELARRAGTLAPDLDRTLKRIDREAARAARVVHNLLALAGSRRLQRRRLSCIRAMKAALAVGAAQRRRAGVTVTWDVPTALPTIRGDAVLMQQALLNLITNAEQAVTGRQDAQIGVHAFGRGDDVILIVEDNGPGLAAHTADRVFEPFFTTREGGSGVGLALTQRIVETFGGRIEAADADGQGARFTITLPAAPQTH